MHILVSIMLVVAGLFVLILIMSAINGKELIIERTILINKPKQEVFDFIRLVKNQDKFSKWNMQDPTMKKEYSGGADGQVGFIYAWDSTNKSAGAGAQEIKKINAGESVEFELRFKRPMENIARAKIITEAVSANQTKVTWGFYGTTKFPMTAMKGMLKNMLGKDMAASLENLKVILENV